jgi:hypothetical protein
MQRIQKIQNKIFSTAHNEHPVALIFWWLSIPLPLYTGWKLWRGLQQRFYWAWWKASYRIGSQNCGDICPSPYFQVGSLINVIQIVHYFFVLFLFLWSINILESLDCRLLSLTKSDCSCKLPESSACSFFVIITNLQ